MEKGVKFDTEKPKLHLIPSVSLYGISKALMYGAQKYARFNFMKGIEYTRLTDSLQRHVLAFLDGENIDPESKLPHVWHIGANAVMLIFMTEKRPEMDDRFKEETIEDIVIKGIEDRMGW